MNFKTWALSTFALLSLQSHAGLIEPIYKYLHNSGKVVELQGVNQSKGTAYYYDYELGKRIQVSLADVSKETNERINGVMAGEFVLAETDQGETVCTTYNVFENGMSYLGCRTGKMMQNIGPSRHQLGGYIASTWEISGETLEAGGFRKGEKVRLKNGKKVKIKAIFFEGVALVEDANPLLLLDTSSTLLKTSVNVVHVRDLVKI